MNKICICGAGTMGSGIAQACASAGFSTILYDLNEEVLERAKQKINNDLDKLVEKGRLQADQKENMLSNIRFTNSIADCIADLVIEAIIEKMEAKIGLFGELSKINTEQTLFASNTSSLSINAIAKHIPGPQRFAGLHFFNPAPVMKLVEVVKGEATSDASIIALVEFTRKLGKQPVVCKDSPGFIVNRVARPFYIESLRIAEEGIADYATIDQILESRGFKMGPFKLMDLIGNDVNYAVSCSVYEQLNRPERLKPSYLQEEKVRLGQLGKKTKKGYYDY
ncbi:3-hydroxyacyl-CoA dehydrogenase NAD-binding domain-containing protein [Flavisolibacter ginsengisoli]|uniref:3-hydroxyacyl-CoA dehydrogenase n=1 Tax=Flavisolibacter ginsengisoli DSM 18119 TaxID=1121884 RepID=A0A1M4VLE0_9BACT|nr:3-hydroxyacyl-CoA dehydrogenase NAD-binding domain-containing protein [Flavisolibacter ginsengisoli]SHE69834.1 3-hydroxybutyryl-CoA dehydrogenase [Flavisolibacter ginsengisoli DSM 18119]